MSFASFKGWLVTLCVMVLVGCGGGGGSDSGTPVLPGDGSGGGGGATPTYALAVKLVDATGATVSSIVAGQPVRAQAVLTRNGTALSGEIVQFAVDQTVSLVKLDPVSGSQLTDTAGLASLTVSSLGASTGAGRIQATATISGTQVTGAANFFASGSVGTQPATLVLDVPTILSPAVSAYGTTGIEVTVRQNGTAYSQPVTVNFTSSCAAGRASITDSAITRPDGKAVATFVDNGCAQTADGTVTITASIGSDTKSANVTVRAPTSGSLRFVSVVPSDKSITLRGQGGNGRQENASLTFKLVDVAGNGVADADICFDATTYVGDLNIDGFKPTTLPTQPADRSSCGVTDVLSVVRYVKRTGPDGTVSVQINSGTVPTPVRVRARTIYPVTAASALETYSDTLSISTGLPLQRSFSLSVDRANIDGGNFDGEISVVTVRLADQFSNPVPDGTVVNFIGSGAAVCTADNGSCRTLNGACSCNVVSQARRPQDNRVIVTAYAVGLEDYDDRNGNNVYDVAGDTFSDLGDAFVDANKDGFAGSGALTGLPNPVINSDVDILVPYQLNTSFRSVGDGVRGTAHIRGSTVIYLSQSSSTGDPTAVMPLGQFSQEQNLLTGDGVSANFVRLQPSCPEGVPLPQATINFSLEDGAGNPMASGTTLASVDSTDNISSGAPRPNQVLAIGARPPSPLIDQPNTFKPFTRVGAIDNGTVYSVHSIVVRGVQDKCSGNASFALEVRSPRGGATTTRVLYDGEPRVTNRGGFDVRYRRDGLSFSATTQGAVASLADARFVGAVGGSQVTGGTIDWADGAGPRAFAGAFLPQALRSATYTASGFKVLSLTVGLADGSTRSTSQTVFVAVP